MLGSLSSVSLSLFLYVEHNINTGSRSRPGPQVIFDESEWLNWNPHIHNLRVHTA